MKFLTLIFIFAGYCSCAQAPTVTEKQDTIFGLAVVIDSLKETVYTKVPPTIDPDGWTTLHADREETRYKLTTAVIPAYTITTYIPPSEFSYVFPHITSVAYYRFEDCTEIQFYQLIAFKH